LESSTVLQRRSVRFKRYLKTGRAPKIAKLGLLGLIIIFGIHMVCIAIGMAQILKIDPESIKIKKIHVSGLDTATGHLRAEAAIPMPFMARFFHINIGSPTVSVHAANSKLLEVQFPSLILG